MKKLVLSVFVLAGLVFVSCNDDDKKDEGTVDVAKMYLPLKINDEGSITSFGYNNKGLVTKITESDGYVYTFNYNGTQLVEIIESEDLGGVNYKTTYTFSQSGTTLSLNWTREYNGEKYTDGETLQLDGKGNLVNDGYFKYTYDANGNVTKMRTEYEYADFIYDAKNGIFKNLNLPKWVVNYILSYQTNTFNNMVSMKYESTEDPEDNNSATVIYEYNADGYPTKATANSTEEGTSVQTIEYTKK